LLEWDRFPRLKIEREFSAKEIEKGVQGLVDVFTCSRDELCMIAC